MAAAAYDVAAFHLKGHAARLNFPELVEKLPMPSSSEAEDIRVAAQQAALQFKTRTSSRISSASGSEGGGNSNSN
ncbi:ethylene-responsive transcription factor, partial [Trifolium medium]|nr:ethylene-responsive transcription factor [Trifolium medium]